MDNLNLDNRAEKKETPNGSSVLKPESDTSFSSLEKAGKNKSKKIPFFIFITLGVIILLLLAGYLVDKYTPINLLGTSSDNIANKQFSAVFLSNGQVYFGTIEHTDDNYTVLKNIYYLQVASPLQQVPANGAQQQPQLVLVKLGNELHGPTDYMKINNQHIIFIERLKSNSKVMEAIKKYKVAGQNQAVNQKQNKAQGNNTNNKNNQQSTK